MQTLVLKLEVIVLAKVLSNSGYDEMRQNTKR